MGCCNFLSYSQRLVAFIDLLGFSDYIKESDIDNAKAITIYSLLHKLDSDVVHGEEQSQSDKCQNGREILAVSDSIIISYPLYPKVPSGTVINLLLDICNVQRLLLSNGWISRGGVSFGNTYHEQNVIFGTAYMKAIELEKQANFPRIVLDDTVMSLCGKDNIVPFSLCDIDKIHFIDYLGILPMHHDGVMIMHTLHEKITDALLRETKPSIIEKYWWLKEYYNYTIDRARDFGSFSDCRRIGEMKTERFH